MYFKIMILTAFIALIFAIWKFSDQWSSLNTEEEKENFIKDWNITELIIGVVAILIALIVLAIIKIIKK